MAVASLRALGPCVLVLAGLGCGPSIRDRDDGGASGTAGETTQASSTIGLEDAGGPGACRDLVPCAPWEVEVTGFCRVVSYAWNGSDCVDVGGCECTGPDCCHLTSTREECLEAVAATCDEPLADA